MKTEINFFERAVATRQWLHSVHAVLTTNAPSFLSVEGGDKAVNEIRREIWELYCLAEAKETKCRKELESFEELLPTA